MVRNKIKGYFWDSIGAIVSPCLYVVETCPSDGTKISFACPGQLHFSLSAESASESETPC